MLETYQEFGYQVIEVPKKSVKLRTDFVINHL